VKPKRALLRATNQHQSFMRAKTRHIVVVAALLALGASTTVRADYKSTILADNPPGYWRLDTVSGDTNGVTNLGWLGPAFGGTVVGSLALTTDTPLVGDSDQATDFSGGGRIAIPFSPYLNQTNTFSYEIWYNATGPLPGFPGNCPLWWRDEPTLGDTEGWVHYNNSSGNYFQSSDVVDTWHSISSTTLLASDVWQHLVCTFDGSTKRMYLNGVLIAVSDDSHNRIRAVKRAVDTISSASYPFVGLLKEAAIYTNALTPARIQAHYTAATEAAPPAVAPSFSIDAVGATNFAGATVQVKVVVLGTEPFSYQWYQGAAPLPGQTNDTLSLSPAEVNESGDYYVSVSNVGGTTNSAEAAILVLAAPPSIVTTPAPAVRLQGASVTFTVTAAGSQPLSYQWLSNNVPLPAPDTNTLTLNHVQPSFAANYRVYITNATGKVTSSVASLTVVPVAPGSLDATVIADQPVAYWRFDDANTNTWLARDYAGGHDGTYFPPVQLGQPSGILGDTNATAYFASGSFVFVPWSADLNTYPAQSVECWAKPDQTVAGSYRPIYSSRLTQSGWHYGYELSANDTDQWEFDTGQRTSGLDSLTGGATTNAAWYHVVGTIDDAAGAKALYVNGALVAQDTPASGTYGINQPLNSSGTVLSAVDQYIATECATNGYNSGYYVGGLAEMAVYNYALSAAQVASHYAAGTLPSLTITPLANGQVVLTWNLGLLLEASSLTGPWTTNTAAVSPWTNTPSGARQFFRALAP